MLGNHEQAILHNMAALSQSVHELIQNMQRLVAIPVPCDAAAAPSPPAESYACDPESFDGDLDRCRGFIMQCELVFSQRVHSFPSNQTRLHPRVFAWHRARVGTGVKRESAA